MIDLVSFSSDTGESLRWQPPKNFSFLRESPLLPAQAVEAGRLASALPLVFQKDASQTSGWSMMILCGTDVGRSIMVDGDDQWVGGVIPHCARYLPFSLKEVGGNKGVVAFDKRYARHVLADADTGVSLYDDEGELHPEAQKRVNFLRQYRGRIEQTQKILKALAAANLFVPLPKELSERADLKLLGLFSIDEKKLAQLDEKIFLGLRAIGALTVVYSSLLSLYQLRKLAAGPSKKGAASGTAIQTTGDLDLEFLKDEGTIKFGPLS